MSVANDKPSASLMVAAEYPAVEPAVRRIFARIFPTLILLDFNALRTDGGRHTENHHWISFSGTEAELLHLGIIDKSMLPVRPKRLADFSHGRIKRLARDRLSVHLRLNESLDRTHPLAPLAVWNWPFVDNPRARMRLVVNNSGQMATAAMPEAKPAIRLVWSKTPDPIDLDCEPLAEMIRRMGQLSPKEKRALAHLRNALKTDDELAEGIGRMVKHYTAERMKGFMLSHAGLFYTAD